MRPALAVGDATISAPLLLASALQGVRGSAAPLLAVKVLHGGAVTAEQHTSAGCVNTARLHSATHCLLLPYAAQQLLRAVILPSLDHSGFSDHDTKPLYISQET